MKMKLTAHGKKLDPHTAEGRGADVSSLSSQQQQQQQPRSSVLLLIVTVQKHH